MSRNYCNLSRRFAHCQDSCGFLPARKSSLEILCSFGAVCKILVQTLCWSLFFFFFFFLLLPEQKIFVLLNLCVTRTKLFFVYRVISRESFESLIGQLWYHISVCPDRKMLHGRLIAILITKSSRLFSSALSFLQLCFLQMK